MTWRQVEWLLAEHLTAERAPLESHDLARDLNSAEAQLRLAPALASQRLGDADLGQVTRRRRPVRGVRFDQRYPVGEIECAYEERLALMQIDRAGMHRGMCCCGVDGAE